MFIIMSTLFFFATPTILLAFLFVSLYSYVSAKKQNKRVPNTVPPDDIKVRKIKLIVIAIITGIFFAIAIGLTALLFLFIAYM